MSSEGHERRPKRHEHNHENVSADDAAGLVSIGKVQAFDRRFSFWTVLGVGICVSGTWEGISASMLQGLTTGGAVEILWGFVLTAVGMSCVAASLAEMASIWPSSGAQYHWASELCPKTWKPLASWYTGWITMTGSLLGGVSCGFGVAVQVQAYAMVSHPDYDAPRWHATMIYFLVTTIFVVFNIFGVRHLKVMNFIAMGIHVVFYFITMIVLLVMTKNKHSASYVFTNFSNSSGWTNDGVAFCVGLLSTCYGFVGIDQPAHFAEEMEHAPRNLPKAIVTTVFLNSIITFPWLVAFLFCVGNLDAVLSSVIGPISPMTQVFINSTRNIGLGIFLNAACSTSIAFGAGVDTCGGTARIIFAMARDKAFPPFLAKVHPKYDVPLNAILVASIPQYLVGIIYIGNSTAFYGIMSGVLVLQMSSYAIPIGFHLFHARRKNDIVLGPWNLGRCGWIIDTVSFCWCIFIIIFLNFPLYQPVTPANMNYACTILGFVLLAASASWLLYGRGRFLGPIVEIEGLKLTATHSNTSQPTETFKDPKLFSTKELGTHVV